MVRNGFRKIGNNLYEALLKADFTRSEYKVVLAVMHFTVGYNQREEAEISLSTFCAMTSLTRPAVISAIKSLERGNVFRCVRSGATQVTSYAFNYDVKSWGGSKAGLPSSSKPGFTSDNVKTLLADPENFTSTSKVPTPATTLLKKERKLLNKTIPGVVSLISNNKVTTPPLPEDISKAYKENVSPFLTSEVAAALATLVKVFPAGWVRDAICLVSKQAVKAPMPFITGVLNNWQKEGHQERQEPPQRKRIYV